MIKSMCESWRLITQLNIHKLTAFIFYVFRYYVRRLNPYKLQTFIATSNPSLKRLKHLPPNSNEKSPCLTLVRDKFLFYIFEFMIKTFFLLGALGHLIYKKNFRSCNHACKII